MVGGGGGGGGRGGEVSLSSLRWGGEYQEAALGAGEINVWRQHSLGGGGCRRRRGVGEVGEGGEYWQRQ